MGLDIQNGALGAENDRYKTIDKFVIQEKGGDILIIDNTKLDNTKVDNTNIIDTNTDNKEVKPNITTIIEDKPLDDTLIKDDTLVKDNTLVKENTLIKDESTNISAVTQIENIIEDDSKKVGLGKVEEVKVDDKDETMTLDNFMTDVQDLLNDNKNLIQF